MPMAHRIRTPHPMPGNSRADMRTGSSMAASVTICLRKPQRPLRKLWSTLGPILIEHGHCRRFGRPIIHRSSQAPSIRQEDVSRRRQSMDRKGSFMKLTCVRFYKIYLCWIICGCHGGARLCCVVIGLRPREYGRRVADFWGYDPQGISAMGIDRTVPESSASEGTSRNPNCRYQRAGPLFQAS